jgi:fructose-bisphosphate aldolase class I
VHEVVLRSLFDAIYQQNVMLDATLLKPSMVLPGCDGDEAAGVEEVAEATLTCIRSTVPAIVPGVLFLSGGQDDERATAHLDAMNRMGPHPWVLSFSYGRALQSAALQVWAEDPASNAGKAQDAVIRRAQANALAALGRWEAGRA